MRFVAVQLVAWDRLLSLRCARGSTPRDPGVAVGTVRVRRRASPPVRSLHRLFLGRHPPADLSHAASDGRRRLGTRDNRGPAGPAGQEDLHGFEEGASRVGTLDRRAARRAARAARSAIPEPATSPSSCVAPRTATWRRRAPRSRRCARNVPTCGHLRGFEKRQFPDPSALRGPALHHYLVLRGGIRAEEGAIG
jgi:hypothetical protein